ncbi:hypothetical protein F2Q69_00014794 [Brassica cretica]|uniref:MATH domain-containing protein n=1 Tax=Brassica cretica TaxID=69181 RepID=A0A8S9QSN2_BRACR|nr:hypothetical protein F2Q69_00014794 [Brassica cretica]
MYNQQKMRPNIVIVATELPFVQVNIYRLDTTLCMKYASYLITVVVCWIIYLICLLTGYNTFYEVESVRLIFKRHPDIAVEFRAKNQHLRKACMDFLLSLIETMCQSLEELSNEDLVEADVALTYLRDAGFKVDWLEKKLDHVKVKKEKEQFCVARLQEMEDSLLELWKKCSDLDALVEKEEEELSDTRTPLSLDDVV